MSSETYVISYDDTPPSLNAGGVGSRRHWAVAYREKRRWEGIWAMLLLERRVPRGMKRCSVEVDLEFLYRHHRDVSNYEAGVTKPLFDALVNGSWLANDTADFIAVKRFELRSGVELPAKSRTTVRIEAEYD